MQYPTIISLTEDQIDFNQLIEEVTLPSTGAAVVFSGMVRAETTRIPRQTDYLEYEAYEPMALDKLRQVAEEIRHKWPSVVGIGIVHRIGTLYPGTPTVLIVCTAPHRDTGVFEAARYGIDRLKEIVPIWKKEVGPGGQEWIEGDYQPIPGD
jgi:molybdopterin synthase catalytic subunit